MFEPGETVRINADHEDLKKGHEVSVIKRDLILFRYLVRTGEREVRWLPAYLLSNGEQR